MNMHNLTQSQKFCGGDGGDGSVRVRVGWVGVWVGWCAPKAGKDEKCSLVCEDEKT